MSGKRPGWARRARRLAATKTIKKKGHHLSSPNAGQLSERAQGWLRYVYRKATVADDWSKGGEPSEMWDANTYPPMLNWHRFDVVDRARSDYPDIPVTHIVATPIAPAELAL